MTIETPEESVREFEKDLGIKIGFLENLIQDDDWSFIIKIHALLESAVSLLLTKSVGNGKLQDIFSTIELSNKKYGKLAFVKALSLLDRPDRRFISSMSELRNKLVHNITNVEFSLKEHVSKLSNGQFLQFAKSFDSFSSEDERHNKSKKDKVREIFRSNHKKAIWFSAMITIGIIYQKKLIEDANIKTRDLREEIAKKYIRLNIRTSNGDKNKS